MKVLLAVDGSEYTKRMLAYLAAHDEFLGPHHEYTALTVVAKIPPHAARHIEHAILDSYYREQAEGVLAPLLAFMGQLHWRVNVVTAQGHAAEIIAEQAESGHHDLLVMGSHGHSALGAVVLGSVAMSVLARCKTPVLLIR